MAEAAGLAVGGIALVTLFQTCVDVLEYIEAARSIWRERERGDNKLHLLEIRLKKWFDDLHVNNPSQEDGCRREYWSKEEVVIGNSLGSVAGILRSITQLKSRYGHHNEAVTFFSGSHSQCSRKLYDKDQVHKKINCYHCSSGIFTIKQRISWAVRGKKRFDALLAELDFFITNLESVTNRPLKSGYAVQEMPSNNSTTTKTPRPLGGNVHTISDYKTGSITGTPNVCPKDLSGNPTKLRDNNTSGFSATNADRKTDPNQQLTHHRFEGNTASGASTQFLGDMGDTGPNAKGHCYVKNESKNNARQFQGNFSAETSKLLIDNISLKK